MILGRPGISSTAPAAIVSSASWISRAILLFLLTNPRPGGAVRRMLTGRSRRRSMGTRKRRRLGAWSRQMRAFPGVRWRENPSNLSTTTLFSGLHLLIARVLSRIAVQTQPHNPCVLGVWHYACVDGPPNHIVDGTLPGTATGGTRSVFNGRILISYSTILISY